MPDKKLTDAEIIKALECCIGDTDGKDCFGCPLYEIDDCQAHLNLAALDLINRLQAKLDEAEDTIQFAYKELKKAEAEIKTELDKLNAEKNDVMYHKAQIKSEAYKEFADKVCDEITDAIINNGKVINERIEKHNVNRLEDSFCCMCDGKIRALGGIEYFIKNLLKEMEGDNQ